MLYPLPHDLPINHDANLQNYAEESALQCRMMFLHDFRHESRRMGALPYLFVTDGHGRAGASRSSMRPAPPSTRSLRCPLTSRPRWRTCGARTPAAPPSGRAGLRRRAAAALCPVSPSPPPPATPPNHHAYSTSERPRLPRRQGPKRHIETQTSSTEDGPSHCRVSVPPSFLTHVIFDVPQVYVCDRTAPFRRRTVTGHSRSDTSRQFPQDV